MKYDKANTITDKPGTLKSDYFRIEISSFEKLIRLPILLKSDYFRIEIELADLSMWEPEGLKSDYFRIEIKDY